MLRQVYSIRDAKTEIFNAPFYKTNEGEAERDFRTVVNDSATSINRYPQDYDLYHLGSFNDIDGKFLALDTPCHVIKGVQCIKRDEVPSV